MLTPTEGGRLIVSLPDERAVARIVKVINDDLVMACLDQGLVISKTHGFHLGDNIGAIRRSNGIGGEIWEALSAADLDKILKRKRKKK